MTPTKTTVKRPIESQPEETSRRGGSRSSLEGDAFVASVRDAIKKHLSERELTVDRCAGERHAAD